LHIINCHATTETSDILGGMRPVRGRALLVADLLRLVKDLIDRWPDREAVATTNLPDFLRSRAEKLATSDDESVAPLTADQVNQLVEFVRTLPDQDSVLKQDNAGPTTKRQKLAPGMTGTAMDTTKPLTQVIQDIESLYKRYNSLFEWADGPLVTAMRAGDFILLDEMSLAEDAVLERLNSVLEPSRTLLLAEKGGTDNVVVTGADEFRLFATMNPGGDFGKRELSPALRNRFTEIWVPPITDQSDIDLVLESALASLAQDHSVIKRRMIDYVQ
jgi:midasin